MKIFDSYLKAGILPSLGGNDEIYKKLIQSAESLIEELEKSPSKIINYTLVAIDNSISEEEPVLQEVETVIAANWQLVRSQFPERPIVLYRAIILQALESLVEKDGENATIIWFAAIDVYPNLIIPQKEQQIIHPFLKHLGNLAEERAVKEWSIEGKEIKVQVPTLELKLIKVSASADVKLLTDSLAAASGPHKADNVAIPNSNPYFSNNGGNWSYQFAPKAAEAIAASLNNGFIQQNQGIDKNTSVMQKTINEYLGVLGQNIQLALQSSIQSSVAVERRSQLLWWKETLYSRSLHKSYRMLSPFESAIAMAYDLFHILPAIFPISVDYILKEAYTSIYGYNKAKIKLTEILSEVDDLKNKQFLDTFLDEFVTPSGRTDLVSFMQRIFHSKVDLNKEPQIMLGISLDKEISFEDLSVWILHCLAAKHLIEN